MRRASYHEITCKTALNPLSSRFLPFSWDLNIYRGCLHGCRYCYAMYSHDYLAGPLDFFSDIHVKVNIVEALEKKLSSRSWQRQTINIGGVTDSYQPAEARYRLMPEILRLLIKYRTPAVISTKSTLILRDYDLIDELSRVAGANIAATIISADDSFLRRMEPHAAKPSSRFAMLKAFKRSGASVGVHLMPLIPYLNDGVADLDRLCAMARESRVDYVLPGMLYLRGRTRGHFFEFIRREYADCYRQLIALYQQREQRQQYKTVLYRQLGALFRKYGLSRDYPTMLRKCSGDSPPENPQLSLF